MAVNSIFFDNNKPAAAVSNSAVKNSAAVKPGSNFNDAFKKAVSTYNKVQNTTMDGTFERAAETYKVPLNLLKAVAKAESNFNPNAVSSCGAQGVMQLMPSTAASLGVANSFDAEQNIMGGAKMLSGLLKTYNGDTELALAAYNAGSGNVAKYGGVPPFKETQNYVKKVMSYAGQSISAPKTMLTSAGSNSAHTSQNVYKTSGVSADNSLRMLQFMAEQMKFNALNAINGTNSGGSNFGTNNLYSSLMGGTSSLYGASGSTANTNVNPYLSSLLNGDSASNAILIKALESIITPSSLSGKSL